MVVQRIGNSLYGKRVVGERGYEEAVANLPYKLAETAGDVVFGALLDGAGEDDGGLV
jgi:hypothetical protein